MYEKVVLIGNLTKDPETRYTPSGTCVSNLTVATSRKRSKDSAPECPDGWKDGYQGRNWELTIFWRVTVWGKMAESCNQYLAKGSQIYVEGEPNGAAENGILNPRIWTDNEGHARANFEITARQIKFLSRANSSESGQSQQRNEPEPVPESEIPF